MGNRNRLEMFLFLIYTVATLISIFLIQVKIIVNPIGIYLLDSLVNRYPLVIIFALMPLIFSVRTDFRNKKLRGPKITPNPSSENELQPSADTSGDMIIRELLRGISFSDYSSLITLLMEKEFHDIFATYATKEWSVENVLFWDEYVEYKKMAMEAKRKAQSLQDPGSRSSGGSIDLIEEDRERLLKKAREIFESFIKVGAVYELNITKEQRDFVFSQIQIKVHITSTHLLTKNPISHPKPEIHKPASSFGLNSSNNSNSSSASAATAHQGMVFIEMKNPISPPSAPSTPLPSSPPRAASSQYSTSASVVASSNSASDIGFSASAAAAPSAAASGSSSNPSTPRKNANLIEIFDQIARESLKNMQDTYNRFITTRAYKSIKIALKNSESLKIILG